MSDLARRDLFKAVAATVAAAGVDVSAKASVVEADVVRPALAVIEVPGCLSQDTAARIAAQWESIIQDTQYHGVKVVVLSDGMTLTLLDAQGKVLNRQL